MTVGSSPLSRWARRALIAASLSLTACGTAFISPVLLDEEVAFDRALLGSWMEAEATDSTRAELAVITGDSLSGYSIAYFDEDHKRSDFEARLGTFAGRRILELRPAALETEQGAYSKSLVLRAYWMVSLDTLGANELRMRGLEQEVLKNTLHREAGATPFVATDEVEVLLTGDTPELRRFLRGYMARDSVFGEPARFVRVGRGK